MKEDLFLLSSLTKRNVKLYFKDKMAFYTSLITPLILLVLFVLFLKNVYISSIEKFIADYNFDSKFLNAFANSWLISSILSVSCVTIAFCSGTVMIDDKISKAVDDLNVAPVKGSIRQFSYLLATFISTMIVVLVLFAVGLIYLFATGCYLSFLDIILILVNCFFASLLGSVLATIINSFIKTQGGLSAVATMVSSMYGFLCGAYMPVSQYPKAMRILLCFNPGAYANHGFKYLFMRGAIDKMDSVPPQLLVDIKDSFDINFYFNTSRIAPSISMLVLILSTVVAMVGLAFFIKKRKNRL